MAEIKVMVVEDQQLVRMGITRMLEDVEDILVVGEAESGEEAIKSARRLMPDVILMDVKMPGIGGIEATRKIVHQLPSTRIIALTALQDDFYAAQVLKVGAVGFLTKGAKIDELTRAIRTVHKGGCYVDPTVNRFESTEDMNPFQKLSEREAQVAFMIVNCHKVQDIADKLHVSPRTINTYRYRIFDKLGIESDVQLTVLAMRHGLIEQN
ncbi:DNA-binding response regulator, NarL/FixJ family, contains REC and HTH domains [Allopseudospirillum japonicum]|uniref:DNA-binding response regulator, NarL/FixJ family, contains REC and HTH domains n=1 Tax=Allopseudospirillum japonicum TaxID=64971 RepID=A0A1H6T6C2_9GAMM|nr:response regulator [Allopseudospirillum japonicum]SEI75639.1 DNA-binding response regulator, NarL/FixJ family, contains REC and HTH domains [Allopseudospirillum japonicum]